ncbi:MAG: regulator [Fibrobacteres bacterium]|nr:regulator [Fibrobacterota bacterium]
MALIPVLMLAMLGFAPRSAQASPADPASHSPSVWEKPRILDGIWKFRSGDSAAWALPGYRDSHWDSVRLNHGMCRRTVMRKDYAWYRIEVDIPPKPGPGGSGPGGSGPGGSLAILHQATTPQEFYWDGELIGRTGRVGASEAEERSGDISLTEVPERGSGPGRHVLAIRLSAHHPVFHPISMRVTLGEYSTLESGSIHEMMVMFFLAGIFVFGAVYRYLNYRASGYGRNTVLFSVFVLSCAAYIVTEYLGSVVDLDPGQRLAVRLALSVAWYFMISMVPDYFIFAETFPYRWLLPVLLIGGLFFAIPMGFVYTGYAPLPWIAPIFSANQAFVYLSMATSVWVIGWAVWRKQTGSSLALMGILSMMAGITVTWVFQVEWAWAAGIAAHVIFLAQAQNRKLSERLAQHRRMDLRSARLEIEILKKNIQPHFLLNSLSSIIAWLEEEPKTAARLVNALADELGILLRISAQKTILIKEELDLCRLHLQVMGLRQDKTYTLEESGIRGDERIPPMVLHTLVENGLTHGYTGRANGAFEFKRQDIPGGARYSLFNDGVPRDRKPGKEKKGEGTGLRYVRTRLEEAFPGRWSLDSRPAPNGWMVTLEIEHGTD